jgi:esterase/lipase
MTTAIDWSVEEIKHKFSNGDYDNKFEIVPNKVRDNHIFDENQSVKWNRDQVVIFNSAIDGLKKGRQDETNRLEQLKRNDLLIAIQNDSKVNAGQALYIYDYVSSHKRGIEKFELLEDLCDLFYKVNRA